MVVNGIMMTIKAIAFIVIMIRWRPIDRAQPSQFMALNDVEVNPASVN